MTTTLNTMLSERLGEATPRVLLVLPPLTQVNTPYPATAYLTGWLRSQGVQTAQCDLGIELVLSLLSQDGLRAVFDEIETLDLETLPESVESALDQRRKYERCITPVIRFLQDEDPTLATRIASGRMLPEGPRFDDTEDLDWAFGAVGVRDRARFIATKYLNDIADVVRDAITPHFAFTRYAERLAAAAPSYDPMAEALAAPLTLLDCWLLKAFEQHIENEKPDIVAFSAPFPGNLYGALRCGTWLAEHHPHITRVLGGGYPNTELRSLQEPRLFDAVDFVCLDDGERPLVSLIEHLAGAREQSQLKRTFVRVDGEVRYINGDELGDVPHAVLPAPDYRGLPLRSYLSVLDVPNPMHRLWSDGRWNKLTIAHGCYWGKCSFCDTTLDYISRYDIAPAAALVDRMETVIEHTGQTGFHFVDEAAPPTGLRDLALELLARDHVVTWWTNIRFERAFTPDLCRLLVASGCIAISGGLEVASDRLLALMKKGVTVAQVSRVAAAFTEAGAMVHAYLMYGFPTQTEQETVDALEVVRQMFGAGVVQSGFWHRFAMTAHSPVGVDPASFGVEALPLAEKPFAVNDVDHVDPVEVDHDALGEGLKASLFNYMHGVGFERPAHSWLSSQQRTTLAPDVIAAALLEPLPPDIERLRARLVWIGPSLLELHDPDSGERVGLALPAAEEPITLEPDVAEWLVRLLDDASPAARRSPRLGEALGTYPADAERTPSEFMDGWGWQQLREAGLLLV